MTQTAAEPGLKATISCRNPGSWLQIYSAAGFEWTEADIPIPDLPSELEGLRILHVSDLHIRHRWDRGFDELLAQIQANPPDILLYTGDFIDRRYNHEADMPIIKRLVDGFKSRLGTVAVLGNHDSDLLGPPLAGLNITLVDHRRLTLSSGTATLEIIGLAGIDRKDVDMAALRAMGPKPPSSVRIVLSHYPDSIRKAAMLKPDLYLCGHSHGGLICPPNRVPIVRHDSLPRRLCSGIHRAFGTWLVANRGFGFSDSFCVRLNCPAEVIEIRLRRV